MKGHGLGNIVGIAKRYFLLGNDYFTASARLILLSTGFNLNANVID